MDRFFGYIGHMFSDSTIFFTGIVLITLNIVQLFLPKKFERLKRRETSLLLCLLSVMAFLFSYTPLFR